MLCNAHMTARVATGSNGGDACEHSFTWATPRATGTEPPYSLLCSYGISVATMAKLWRWRCEVKKRTPAGPSTQVSLFTLPASSAPTAASFLSRRKRMAGRKGVRL